MTRQSRRPLSVDEAVNLAAWLIVMIESVSDKRFGEVIDLVDRIQGSM